MSSDKIQKLLAIARDQAGTPEGDNAALAAGKLMARTEGFDPEVFAKVPTVHFDTPWQRRLMAEFSTLLHLARYAVPDLDRVEKLERQTGTDSAAMVVGGLLAIAHLAWPSEALGGIVAGAMAVLVLLGVGRVKLLLCKTPLVFNQLARSVEACDRLLKEKFP